MPERRELKAEAIPALNGLRVLFHPYTRTEEGPSWLSEPSPKWRRVVISAELNVFFQWEPLFPGPLSVPATVEENKVSSEQASAELLTEWLGICVAPKWTCHGET